MSEHPAHLSPAARRLERRRQIAEALGRAMSSSHAVQTVVAAGVGVSETRFRRWLDPHEDASIPLADVLALPAGVRRALAELLAESLGATLAEVPTAADPTSALRRHARATREAGELLAAHAEAIEDGHITAAEGAELERQAEDVIREASAIREVGRLAQRERVVPIRAVEGQKATR